MDPVLKTRREVARMLREGAEIPRKYKVAAEVETVLNLREAEREPASKPRAFKLCELQTSVIVRMLHYSGGMRIEDLTAGLNRELVRPAREKMVMRRLEGKRMRLGKAWWFMEKGIIKVREDHPYVKANLETFDGREFAPISNAPMVMRK